MRSVDTVEYVQLHGKAAALQYVYDAVGRGKRTRAGDDENFTGEMIVRQDPGCLCEKAGADLDRTDADGVCPAARTVRKGRK